MIRHLIYCALLSLIIAVQGCQVMKSAETETDQPPIIAESEIEYRTAFKAWTREGRIYDGLDVKLISSLTFKSSQFRRAYTYEYARLYRLNDSEKNDLMRDQRKAADAYHDFMFAVYVPEVEWNDFSKKKSMWKIYITRDGVEQIKPLEIRKIKQKDGVLAYFYPYITVWKSIYRIRFPIINLDTDEKTINPNTDSITLVITSVLGSAEVEWKIQY